MQFKELDKAFEKLLSNLSIAVYYPPYKDEQNEYAEMNKLIIEEKIKYDKAKDVHILSMEILEDVHLRSLPLLEKYAIEDGNYAEQIEVWSDCLLNLYKKLLLIEKEK